MFLLTILQKLQSLVQIVTVYRDQTHDHVAVTCKLNKRYHKNTFVQEHSFVL